MHLRIWIKGSVKDGYPDLQDHGIKKHRGNVEEVMNRRLTPGVIQKVEMRREKESAPEEPMCQGTPN